MRLNREVITETALRLLSDTGIDGLTLRVIADALGVRPPALYWHVANKQELIDHLAAKILNDGLGSVPPRQPGESWVDWLAEVASSYRRLMLAYRDGATILLRYQANDPTKDRLTELILRTLTDAGIPLAEAGKALTAVLSYTIGHVVQEQARVREGAPSGRLDPALYPLTVAAQTALATNSANDSFDYGLRLLLGGLRLARLAQ